MGKQAIEGQRESIFKVSAKDVVIIGVDTKDGMGHPFWVPSRRYKNCLDERLIASFMKFGFFDPVLVQKSPDGKVLLVDGRVRTLNLREANRRLMEAGQPEISLLCQIWRGGGVDQVAVAANTFRKSDSPMTKIEMAQSMLARQTPVEDILFLFNLTEDKLEAWLKVSEAHNRVKNALEDGSINLTAAISLSSLAFEQQLAALDQILGAKPPVAPQPTQQQSPIQVTNPIPQRNSRGTGAAARRIANGQSGKASKKAPTPLLKKIEKYHAESQLSPDIVAMIRWVLDASPENAKKIKGLTEMLKGFEACKRVK